MRHSSLPLPAAWLPVSQPFSEKSYCKLVSEVFGLGAAVPGCVALAHLESINAVVTVNPTATKRARGRARRKVSHPWGRGDWLGSYGDDRSTLLLVKIRRDQR